MIRTLPLILAAFAATQTTAQEEVPLDERVRVLAAEEIGRRLSRPGQPGQAEVSRMVQGENGITLCATSDAYNNNGTYIGRDYWEVTVDPAGTEVQKTRNVTGLLSPCYGAEYAPFKELLQN